MHESGAFSLCRNCGTQLAGEYCSHCGEERFHEHQLSWKHFVHDAMHEFLHVDGKIVRSVGYLLFRPGLLTAEYWAGRKPRYIRPLRLFLIAAAIHLIVMSATVYRFDFFLGQAGDTKLDAMFGRMAERGHVSKAAIVESLDHKLQKIYSVVQYGAVLGFAWVPLAIYRKRRPHYVEHLIFSLHVYSAYFVYSSITSRLISVEQWRRGPSMMIMVIYLVFALKRLYGEGWGNTIVKALVVRVGLFAAEFVVIGIAVGASIAWVRMAGAGH